MSSTPRFFPVPLVLGFLSASTSLVALIRELVIGTTYGADQATDALFLGLTPFFLLSSLSSAGNTGNAVIPVLSQNRENRLEIALSSTIISGFVAAASLGLANFLAGPALISLLGIGLEERQVTDAIWVNSVASVAVVGLLVAATLTAVANHARRFIQPGVGDLTFVATTALGAALVASRGLSVHQVALAFAIGAWLNVAISASAVGAETLRLVSFRRFSWPIAAALGKRFLTVSAMTFAGHPALIAERIAAGTMSPGSITAAYYGRRAASFVAGATGGAVGTYIFPALSVRGAEDRDTRVSYRLKALVMGAGLVGTATVLAAFQLIDVGIANWKLIVRGVTGFAFLIPVLSLFYLTSRSLFARTRLGPSVLVMTMVGIAGAILVVAAWVLELGVVGLGLAATGSVVVGLAATELVVRRVSGDTRTT